MPIYYRSDKRGPEEIFKTGFITKKEDKNNDKNSWWINAIKVKYKDEIEKNKRSTDARKDYAICMTTKFESAAIFPLKAEPSDEYPDENLDTYIYAIALPQATQLEYENKERDIYLLQKLPENLEKYENSYIAIKFPVYKLFYVTPDRKINEFFKTKELEKLLLLCAGLYCNNKPIQAARLRYYFWKEISKCEGHNKYNLKIIEKEELPTNHDEIVIDLHSLQVIQSKYISQFFKKNKKYNSLLAGSLLYAYEAIAHKISPKNIIACVKIVRNSNDNGENIDKVFYQCEIKYHQLLAMNFNIKAESDIIKNDAFLEKQNLLVNSNQGSKWIIKDYSHEKKEALEKFMEAKQKENIETTSVYFGLGGKTF